MVTIYIKYKGGARATITTSSAAVAAHARSLQRAVNVSAYKVEGCKAVRVVR